MINHFEQWIGLIGLVTGLVALLLQLFQFNQLRNMMRQHDQKISCCQASYLRETCAVAPITGEEHCKGDKNVLNEKQLMVILQRLANQGGTFRQNFEEKGKKKMNTQKTEKNAKGLIKEIGIIRIIFISSLLTLLTKTLWAVWDKVKYRFDEAREEADQGKEEDLNQVLTHSKMGVVAKKTFGAGICKCRFPPFFVHFFAYNLTIFSFYVE